MTTSTTKLKSSLWAAAGLVLLSNALLLLQRHPAQAQSPGINLAVLQSQLADLLTRVAYLESHPLAGPKGTKGAVGALGPVGPLGPQGAAGPTGTTGPKGLVGAAGPFGPKGPLGAAGAAGPAGPQGSIGPQGVQGVQGPAVTLPFTVTGSPDVGSGLVTLSGYNLHVVSGSGSTSDGTADAYGTPTGQGALTGLGNVIIGYNALQGQGSKGPRDFRTGSHNLILGDQNNYTSFGGLVAGENNTISAPYATVSGGSFNTASGPYSSVSGGQNNKASGLYASVSGGSRNFAQGVGSSVSGGGFNNNNGPTVSGDYSSVSGGIANTASGQFSSVSGGPGNTTPDQYGWAAGNQNSSSFVLDRYSGKFTSH